MTGVAVEPVGFGGLGGCLEVGAERDEFDIDVRLHSPTFLTMLGRSHRARFSPVALETEEITCQPECDIVVEPPEGTNDCCEGGASIIPISGGDFTCDCPDSAFCGD
jgi:hypothetical protein